MLHGRVGVAPGTITMRLGDQNPGVRVRNANGDLMGARPRPGSRDWRHPQMSDGLGRIRPDDFEAARSYREYLPVQYGWIVAIPETQGMAGFGNGTATATMTAEEQLVQERIESEKSMRTWTAVSALVGVGGLIIALVSLARR